MAQLQLAAKQDLARLQSAKSHDEFKTVFSKIIVLCHVESFMKAVLDGGIIDAITRFLIVPPASDNDFEILMSVVGFLKLAVKMEPRCIATIALVKRSFKTLFAVLQGVENVCPVEIKHLILDVFTVCWDKESNNTDEAQILIKYFCEFELIPGNVLELHKIVTNVLKMTINQRLMANINSILLVGLVKKLICAINLYFAHSDNLQYSKLTQICYYSALSIRNLSQQLLPDSKQNYVEVLLGEDPQWLSVLCNNLVFVPRNKY